VLGASALILTVNAWRYPWSNGYDAQEHAAYADYLVERGAIPTAATNEHYYTPPGYYGVAGAIDRLGVAVGLREPQQRKLVQLFNVPLVLATALLTFLLARLLWPERRLLQVAAATFVAFTPVVVKTGAMFHPETLSLFLSTLGLYVAARLIARGRLGWLPGVALGVVLGAGQLVRSQAAWTFAACSLALLLLPAGDVARRRAVAATLAGMLVGTAALAGWWYVRQTVEYGSPLDYKHTAFTVAGTHPGASVGPWTLDKPVWERRPLSFYVDPGLPQLFSRPYRPSYLGAGIPVTYSELWGDWLGVWRRNPDVSPTRAATRDLGVQNGVGLLPTLLGLTGFVALAVRARRRRDAALLVPALIAVSLLAYAYFVVAWPSPDGDVLKATYLLTSVPAWAVAAAYALDRLPRRPLQELAVAALAISALVELRFVVW
jgi:hypothetical protein